MLVVENLEARYGGNLALKGVSLQVSQGETVCLIGANGAGKTTLLNCICGIHGVRSGRVVFRGKDVSRARPHDLVRLGIVQVPENRQLFSPLTVEENLELGAYLTAGTMTGAALLAQMDRVFERFPRLRDFRKRRAGTLSGGEQQMVAIGRGLMSNPQLLLLDEPSLGLAPLLVREIFSIIRELQQEGRTILLVEQNAVGALKVSERGYVLENGRMTMTGPAIELLSDGHVRQAFLGHATDT